jgi:single-stranded-DNA-specific exonuclease
VASRIVERYQKPVILIAIGEDGIGKGSGRSVEGINIYSALSECRDLFEKFGGHELAAGMSIREEKIVDFRKTFERAVRESNVGLISRLNIDCLVDLADIDDSLVSELDLLAPFGIGNPEPLLLSRSVEVVSQRVFKDKHLGLKLKGGERILDAIWFNLRESVTVPNRIDIVFTPEFNTWNGKKEIRLRIRDVKW